MNVSVCMITWNEEALLARALASITGLADEVIVVDTGSEDGTVELARSLGAKTYTDGDRMNKGLSRNLAIDRASGDWVVILDADETIADPEGLRAYLEGCDAQAVYIKLVFMDGQNRPTLSYQQMRCWRRQAFRYRYRAHEVPEPTQGWGKVEHSGFVWEHRPPRGRGWKVEYTLQRLLLDVAENPGASRPLYYLGRQYMYLKDWAQAAETLERYLACPGIDAADAWCNLAECKKQLGDESGQIVALHRACAALPGRREWWCQLAELYHRKGQHRLATGLLRCALEIPMPARSYTAHYWYRSGTHDLLARSLWKQGRYEEGHEQALKAAEAEPENQRLWDNLAWFESKLGQGADRYLNLGEGIASGLKVLMIGYEDYSGKAYASMEAWNQYGPAGGKARLITYQESYLRYPRDIYRPSADQLALLLEWADVIHAFDWLPFAGVSWGKPVVMTYSGKFYREHWELWNDRDRRLGAVQLCSTLDLEDYGARWCPRPMSALAPAQAPEDRFVVAHAPTRRNPNKGTDEVIRQLSEEPGIELRLIENVSNAACLAQKADAHLYVDQFLMGYGTNALEAWAMGIPVIAGVGDPELRARILERVGYVPFVETAIEDLKATVLRLREDLTFYDEARERGRRYVAEYHGPARIAGLLAEAYAEAIAGQRNHSMTAETEKARWRWEQEAERMDAFYRRHGPLIHTKRGRHKVIAEHVEGDRILDVGCGTGDLLLLLQGNGYKRLVGTEISAVALDMARERGIKAELIRTPGIPKGPFSTVIMSQVLEHVPDDRGLVMAAAEELDPGGLLIASVPIGGLSSGRFHKREYDPESFQELLENVGAVRRETWEDPLRMLMIATRS